MSQRSAGWCTRCTRANAFPVHVRNWQLCVTKQKIISLCLHIQMFEVCFQFLPFTGLIQLLSSFKFLIFMPSLIFYPSWICMYMSQVESVQDFFIKLDIKPLMHVLETSIFSLNNDLVRLTKIMNSLVKDLKILSFKVIFQCLKLVKSFQKKNSVKNIWLGDQLILMKFFENFHLLKNA